MQHMPPLGAEEQHISNEIAQLTSEMFQEADRLSKLDVVTVHRSAVAALEHQLQQRYKRLRSLLSDLQHAAAEQETPDQTQRVGNCLAHHMKEVERAHEAMQAARLVYRRNVDVVQQQQRKELMGAVDFAQRQRKFASEEELLEGKKDVTASLKRTKQLMAQSLEQTHGNISVINASNKRLNAAGDELVSQKDVFKETRRHQKTLHTQSWMDRWAMYIGFAFFMLCVAYISFRRTPAFMKQPLYALLHMKHSGQPFTDTDYATVNVPPGTFLPSEHVWGSGEATLPPEWQAWDSNFAGVQGPQEGSGPFQDAEWLDADQHEPVQRAGGQVWDREALMQDPQRPQQPAHAMHHGHGHDDAAEAPHTPKQQYEHWQEHAEPQTVTECLAAGHEPGSCTAAAGGAHGGDQPQQHQETLDRFAPTPATAPTSADSQGRPAGVPYDTAAAHDADAGHHQEQHHHHHHHPAAEPATNSGSTWQQHRTGEAGQQHDVDAEEAPYGYDDGEPPHGIFAGMGEWDFEGSHPHGSQWGNHHHTHQQHPEPPSAVGIIDPEASQHPAAHQQHAGQHGSDAAAAGHGTVDGYEEDPDELEFWQQQREAEQAAEQERMRQEQAAAAKAEAERERLRQQQAAAEAEQERLRQQQVAAAEAEQERLRQQHAAAEAEQERLRQEHAAAEAEQHQQQQQQQLETAPEPEPQHAKDMQHEAAAETQHEHTQQQQDDAVVEQQQQQQVDALIEAEHEQGQQQDDAMFDAQHEHLQRQQDDAVFDAHHAADQHDDALFEAAPEPVQHQEAVPEAQHEHMQQDQHQQPVQEDVAPSVPGVEHSQVPQAAEAEQQHTWQQQAQGASHAYGQELQQQAESATAGTEQEPEQVLHHAPIDALTADESAQLHAEYEAAAAAAARQMHQPSEEHAPQLEQQQQPTLPGDASDAVDTSPQHQTQTLPPEHHASAEDDSAAVAVEEAAAEAAHEAAEAAAAARLAAAEQAAAVGHETEPAVEEHAAADDDAARYAEDAAPGPASTHEPASATAEHAEDAAHHAAFVGSEPGTGTEEQPPLSEQQPEADHAAPADELVGEHAGWQEQAGTHVADAAHAHDEPPAAVTVEEQPMAEQQPVVEQSIHAEETQGGFEQPPVLPEQPPAAVPIEEQPVVAEQQSIAQESVLAEETHGGSEHPPAEQMVSDAGLLESQPPGIEGGQEASYVPAAGPEATGESEAAHEEHIQQLQAEHAAEEQQEAAAAPQAPAPHVHVEQQPPKEATAQEQQQAEHEPAAEPAADASVAAAPQVGEGKLGFKLQGQAIAAELLEELRASAAAAPKFQLPPVTVSAGGGTGATTGAASGGASSGGAKGGWGSFLRLLPGAAAAPVQFELRPLEGALHDFDATYNDYYFYEDDAENRGEQYPHPVGAGSAAAAAVPDSSRDGGSIQEQGSTGAELTAEYDPDELADEQDYYAAELSESEASLQQFGCDEEEGCTQQQPEPGQQPAVAELK